MKICVGSEVEFSEVFFVFFFGIRFIFDAILLVLKIATHKAIVAADAIVEKGGVAASFGKISINAVETTTAI